MKKHLILLCSLLTLCSTHLYAQDKVDLHANMTCDINFLPSIGDLSSAFTLGSTDDFHAPYAPSANLGLGIGIDIGRFSVDLRADVGLGYYSNNTITNDKQDHLSYLTLGAECWGNEQSALDAAIGIGMATSKVYVANRDLDVSQTLQSTSLIVPITITYWIQRKGGMGYGFRLNYAIPCCKIGEVERVGLSSAGMDLSQIKINPSTLGLGVIFQL